MIPEQDLDSICGSEIYLALDVAPTIQWLELSSSSNGTVMVVWRITAFWGSGLVAGGVSVHNAILQETRSL